MHENDGFSVSCPIPPAHSKCVVDFADGLKRYRYTSLCRSDGGGTGLVYVSFLHDGEVAYFRCFDMVEDTAGCLSALEWKGVDWGAGEHARRMYRALAMLLRVVEDEFVQRREPGVLRRAGRRRLVAHDGDVVVEMLEGRGLRFAK